VSRYSSSLEENDFLAEQFVKILHLIRVKIFVLKNTIFRKENQPT
jgi:hypothetical protein